MVIFSNILDIEYLSKVTGAPKRAQTQENVLHFIDDGFFFSCDITWA